MIAFASHVSLLSSIDLISLPLLQSRPPTYLHHWYAKALHVMFYPPRMTMEHNIHPDLSALAWTVSSDYIFRLLNNVISIDTTR